MGYFINKIYDEYEEYMNVDMGPDYAILISAFHHKVIFHSVLLETTKPGYVHIRHIGYPGISRIHHYNHHPDIAKKGLSTEKLLHLENTTHYMMGITTDGFAMHIERKVPPTIYCKSDKPFLSDYRLYMNATDCSVFLYK